MKDKIIFWALIALSAIMAILFETNILESGLWGGNDSVEFVVLTAVEILTVIIVPVALKMKRSLASICMICVPMAVYTLLYYMMLNTTFGYLALLMLVCTPFVKPLKQVEGENEEANDSNSKL